MMAMERIREGYLSGEYTVASTLLMLQEMGMTTNEAEQKLCNWEVGWHATKAFIEQLSKALEGVGRVLRKFADTLTEALNNTQEVKME